MQFYVWSRIFLRYPIPPVIIIIIIIIILLLKSFSYLFYHFFFPWCLSDKFSQVSRNVLSILDDFDNAMIWMVPIFPPISGPVSLFSSFLPTIPRAPTTFCITVIFMFPNFYDWTNAWFFSIFLILFSLWDPRNSKICQIRIYVISFNTRSSLLADI